MAERKKRVLVADDDISTRESVVELVISMGHECIAVDDGVPAYEQLIIRPPFDLVISDLDMKDMSGLELLHHVRRNPSLADLSFVLISGRDIPREAQELGAVCMTKPAKDLDHVIELLLKAD